MEAASNPAPKNAKELREEKQRDAKIEEQLLKSLNSCPNIDEKFTTLVKKYVDLEKENKKLNTLAKQNEKRLEIILREKDILQKEHNKGILMRDKLEQVCREQQKLIKSVKNESMTKIREEEERRKENQAKFQHSINEINVTLNKNNDENIKLKEDNIEMAKKLKYLAEQYQVREKQLEKITEQISLESQLHEAKLQKFQMEATIDKEILLREKQGALDELLKCKKAIKEMQSREDLLKDQLNVYTSKYDDFQNSLQKSNDIFVSYKTEIEKMSKKIKKLEKESIDWKRKWERSNSSLLDLATEKQVRDEYITKSARQMQQLQKLLRTLQAERTSLHQVLKENNIESPPMPVLPPEPEPISLPPPSKPQNDKVEIMAKSCAELKETLAKLQGQMNAITNKETAAAAPPAEEPDTKKSNKNKKSKNKNKNGPNKENKEKQSTNAKLAETAENSKLPPAISNDEQTVELEKEETSKDSIEGEAVVVAAENVTRVEENVEKTIEVPKADEKVPTDDKNVEKISTEVVCPVETAEITSTAVETGTGNKPELIDNLKVEENPIAIKTIETALNQSENIDCPALLNNGMEADSNGLIERVTDQIENLQDVD